MAKKSHGLSRGVDGNKTPEYRAWAAMKQRCYNENCAQYSLYGGRGIEVHPDWLNSFQCFYADMGPRPTSSHSLDRVDNAKGYSKSNCRWATPSQQSANQRDRKRVCRKTDVLLLELAPALHSMGFSMRNIAALFSVGKTTVERVLSGKLDTAVIQGGKVYMIERREANLVKRTRRCE